MVLHDLTVTENVQADWSLRIQNLYSIHTVGLYIIIYVPDMGLTVTWDKQTRVKIELKAKWKVSSTTSVPVMINVMPVI